MEKILNFQYSDDLSLKSNLLQKRDVKKAVEIVNKSFSGYGMSHVRNHYAKSVRMHKELYPEVFEILDTCAEKLQKKLSIKVFVSQSPYFNGYCFKSGADEYVIGLTSAIFERFDKQELAFVIGHELGHAVFKHFELPMPIITSIRNSKGQSLINVQDKLELFIWSRSAEISADRAGIVCCDDLLVAINALYKLSSGLNNKIDLKQAEKFLKQLDALVLSPSSRPEFNEADLSLDCFQTHPYSPIRIKALFEFANSTSFKGEKSLLEVDKEIKQSLSIMEPSYLEKADTSSKLLKYFFFYTSIQLAKSDGEISPQEKELITKMISLSEYDEIRRETPEFVNKRIQNLIEDINKNCSISQKSQVIVHLSIVYACDDNLGIKEKELLYHYANSLGVSSELIDETVRGLTESLD